MTTTYKKIFSILLFLLATSFASFAHADTKIKSSDLAISFSSFDFFNFGSAKEEEKAKKTSDSVELEEYIKDSCEHFDNTSENISVLEIVSADAKQKIENVEETIQEEMSLRENIFDSVKGLIGLQRKDRVIFREMRKDIGDAKNYYDELDQQVASTTVFINENTCEDVALAIIKKVDNDTEALVQDEVIFRKQFAATLKEKMRILQAGVKEAKK